MSTSNVSRITGIEFSPDEVDSSWDVRVKKERDLDAGVREYFLDGGFLGWDYIPKKRRPGERWRSPPSQPPIEISDVLYYIEGSAGLLTIEDRLTRWGIVMHTASLIGRFQHECTDCPEEWARILLVLDICEEDIQTMLDFTSRIYLLNPITNLIPMRVLEVTTAFRALFRLSLHEFELAYDASEN